jgi:deoxyadenosine/deoxycytidine kinase
MDTSEYEVYKSLYTNFEKMTMIENVKIIYLKCTPEKCFERTKKRKRSEEKEIPI